MLSIKKHITSKWILSIAFMLLSISVSAQTGRVTATVDKDLVAIGERFKYTVKVENLGGSLIEPEFEGFNVIGRPMQQQGRSNVNGKVTSYTNLTYTVMATKEGQLTIQPAAVSFEGKIIKSKAVKIKVVATAEEVASAGKKANIRKSEDENLFARIYVDKTKVFKGEQVTVTYVLYNRYQGTSLRNYEIPQLEGFWKEDVKIGDIRFSDKMEKVNGMDYQKAVLARQVLIAQKTGDLKIGPLKLTAVVRRGFFNVTEIPMSSNAPTVKVMPLPGAPDTFTGGVGNLDFSVSIDNNRVNTNDAINLKVKVSGKGNLKLVGIPEIEFDPDFEVYDPKVNDKISTSGGGMNGSRTYDYLIIPRFAGKYVIDPITFTYFDSKKEKFVNIKSKELVINVDGDPEDSAARSERRKKEVSIIDEDIRYINTDSKFSSRNKFFAGSSTHMLLFLLPFLLLGGLWFYKKHIDKGRDDVTGTRIRKAGKKALKEINLAKTALQENKKEAFYESVFDAMYNYLSEKLNIPYADLTKENIASSLLSRNVDDQTISNLKNVLESCEMARFAPRAKTDDEVMLKTADEIIHNLEKQLT